MKRSELPDSVFGIPEERKYPMPDKRHTLSAIKLFGHVEPKYEEELARNIIKNMKKYNIPESAVGKDNKLRKYIDKYYNESVGLIVEKYIMNEDDIYYNKDKFDSGETNLCFITGHSGSGKSTMGRNMQSDNIEHYELDDLQCIKDHFTMQNLKEYGDLIYSYFNGQGKRFYITYQELKDNNIPGSEYEDILFKDFVHYAMKYAKSHKNKKYVIEGVWLYCGDDNGTPWFTPEEFKDYAFYIKGTSAIISKHRAALRDAREDSKGNKINTIKIYLNNMIRKNWKWYLVDESRINKFRKYFSKLMQTNESTITELVEEKRKYHEARWNCGEKINEATTPSSEYSMKPLKPEQMKEYYKWFKVVFNGTKDSITEKEVKSTKVIYYGNDIIGYIAFSRYRDGNERYLGIGNFMVIPKYQRSGHGKNVINYIINKYKDTYDLIYCWVDRSNTNAINFYKKIGKVNMNTKSNPDQYYVEFYRKGKKNMNEGYITNDPNKKIPEYVLQAAGEKCIEFLKWCRMDDSKFAYIHPVQPNKVWVNEEDNTFTFANYDGKLEWLPQIIETFNKNNLFKYGEFRVYVKDMYNETELSNHQNKKFLCGEVTEYNEASSINHIEESDNNMIEKIKLNKNGEINESTISEFSVGAGPVVGITSSPEPIYIVNYLQNNVFSGAQQERFGICKAGMKDLHIYGGKYNRLHLSNLEEFEKEASNIRVYRYTGTPLSSIYSIIEDSCTDLDFYRLLTGEDINKRSDIEFNPNFVRESYIKDELSAITECVNAGVKEIDNKYEIPLIGLNEDGRSYNYYRDLDGVYIKNEVTNMRSGSYTMAEDIPEEVSKLVKKGVY